MKPFSVLIPTYNRREKLAVVLAELAKQEGIEQGEVIVGVDGSTDGTVEDLQVLQETFPGELRSFRIENSGRSVIRNQLLDRAQGDIILFIQDDIVVRPGWLQAHLRAHRRHPQPGAVVGYVTWYPEQEVTPYMRWLEQGGHMLDFSGYRDGDEMDFWHFYMGNISIPRSLISDQRFDEDFPSYGWEDILFGRAFVDRGHQVYYSQLAAAYHWDEYLEENLQDYMHQVGRSAVHAERLYPGTGFVPPVWKSMIFDVMIGAGRVCRPLLSQRWRWYIDMKKSFLEAVRNSS